MRRHLFAAVFLLLSIFGVQIVSTLNIPEFAGTSLESGCHDFYGKIECQNGQQILPSAKVSVMEYDDISINDIISTAKVYERGYYKIVGCTNVDGIMGNGEIFLEFEDVCFDGQRFQVSNPKPDTFESHLIGNENDIGNGVEILSNDKNQVPDSNHPVSRLQYLRSKYPPMPRPHDRRRRSHVHKQDSDLMNINADKKRGKRALSCEDGYITVPSGKYTFKGSIKCYNEKDGYTMPFSKTGVVKIMEYDVFLYDDLEAASPINKTTGEYEVSGEIVDYHISWTWNWFYDTYEDVQLYLKFENVCSLGDTYEFRCPQPFEIQNLKIENGEVKII